MRWIVLLSLLLNAAAQEPEENGVAFTVSGTAHDAAGKPLAGLSIQLWDATAPERFLGQVTTGPRGRFFAGVRAAAASRREHTYGPVLLVVRGKNLAQVRLVVPAGARDVDVRVVPAVKVEGVVQDHGRQPLPAIVVRALRDGMIVEETTTGEDGRFVFLQLAGATDPLRAEVDGIVAADAGTGDGLRVLRFPEIRRATGRVLDASGAPVKAAGLWLGDLEVGLTDAAGAFDVPAARYRVHAPGYKFKTVVVDEGGDNDVRLEKTPPLRGSVVDAADRPLAECRVSIDGHPLAVWTDERGGYAFAVVPSGRFALTITRRGYLDAHVRVGAGSGADTLTVRLLKGTRVAGRVTPPAPGVRVAAGPHEAYTDQAGRFLIRGVAPDVRRLRAEAPGRRSSAVALAGLAEGATIGPVALELKAALPLAGTLRSDAGMPLAGVEVACGERRVRTDPGGRFDFGALPIARYTVAARPERHAPVEFRATPGDEIVLVAESRFGAGDISVETEGPADTVTLTRRAEPRITRRAAPPCTFRGLPAGAYEVRVEADGFLDAVEQVRLRERGSRTVMVALKRGGSLALTTSPGASVLIQAVSGKPPPIAALKLATGKKELEGFGPGVYRLVARGPGELLVVKRIELGPHTPPQALDLRGGKAATLVVTVTDRAGTVLEDAEVTLVAGGFRWNTRKRTGADGTVELDRLFAGEMEVHAKRGGRIGVEPLTVKPGTAHTVTVVIR